MRVQLASAVSVSPEAKPEAAAVVPLEAALPGPSSTDTWGASSGPWLRADVLVAGGTTLVLGAASLTLLVKAMIKNEELKDDRNEGASDAALGRGNAERDLLTRWSWVTGGAAMLGLATTGYFLWNAWPESKPDQVVRLQLGPGHVQLSGQF